MNRDLIFFILCMVFIVGVTGWFIWNIWLEDYFLFREFKKKESDFTPYQQERLDELVQRIDKELQSIDELEQLMDELDKGDDDKC